MSSYSLASSILEQSQKRPDALALAWQGRWVTYGELAGMAWSAYAQMTELSPTTSGPVGILAGKSPDSVALVLACLMARRPFLLPAADLGRTALDALFRVARCATVLAPRTDLAARRSGLVTHPVTVGLGGGGAADLPVPRPDEIGFMLTTSGSTGLPKVAPLTAGAVDRFTDWAAARFELASGGAVLNYAPIHFDLCLLDIWATLRAGGSVVLVEQDHAANPRYLADLLSTHAVRVVQAVPMFYRLLLDPTAGGGRCFPDVEHVIFTGDSLPRRTLDALPDLFPNARLYNVYGCTETNDSFIWEVDRTPASRSGPVPIGRPLPGVHELVVADDDRVVAGSGSGELWVSTPFQTPGYLDGTGTDASFVSHEGRVYFRTGDLVSRDNGVVTFVGRADFTLKVRGVRVNLAAVEQTLLDHDAVVEAAVVAVPDDLAGHRLHAVVRLRPDSGADSLSLSAHCADRLPRAAVPSTIWARNTPLPRTPTGKMDRRRIVELSTTGRLE